MQNRYHVHMNGRNIAIFHDKGKGYRNPLLCSLVSDTPTVALGDWAMSAPADTDERKARWDAVFATPPWRAAIRCGQAAKAAKAARERCEAYSADAIACWNDAREDFDFDRVSDYSHARAKAAEHIEYCSHTEEYATNATTALFGILFSRPEATVEAVDAATATANAAADMAEDAAGSVARWFGLDALVQS